MPAPRVSDRSKSLPTLQKTGTYLHESAATHARALALALEEYDVDEAAMRSFLPPHRKTTPSCVLHDEWLPTKVVQMNLDDGLIASIKRELLLRSHIDAAISDKAAGTYFPLSTQFENSILFLPSAQRFYCLNKDLVAGLFPDLDTAVVNAFVVPANKRPYGAHNAGCIGFQIPALAQRRMGYPVKHMSIHTACTPTPLDRQPLVVFEDAITESPNTSFLYDRLREYDLAPEEARIVDKAYYLHDSGKLSEIYLPTVRDFLLCKYWEKKYATMPERSSGYYCEVQPGQAVVFDNYRPHGDSTLPVSPETRVTIDIRCFSKVKYPAKKSSGVDLILNPETKERQKKQKRAALECLLMLLDYEDVGDFLRTVYGTEDVDPFEIMTDLQFGVYNKTEHYILDQDLEPHFERVERVYDRIEREGGFEIPRKAKQAIAALYAQG